MEHYNRATGLLRAAILLLEAAAKEINYDEAKATHEREPENAILRRRYLQTQFTCMDMSDATRDCEQAICRLMELMAGKSATADKPDAEMAIGQAMTSLQQEVAANEEIHDIPRIG